MPLSHLRLNMTSSLVEMRLKNASADWTVATNDSQGPTLVSDSKYFSPMIAIQIKIEIQKWRNFEKKNEIVD